jgi:hypothetical protein
VRAGLSLLLLTLCGLGGCMQMSAKPKGIEMATTGKASADKPSADKPSGDPRLVGQWQRHSGGPCAAGYAAHLRIEANGLYFGQTEPPGAFTWWDGGTWRVNEAGRLSLSTANDAVVTYGYRIDGDVLSFTDDKDCRFSFRRLT